MNRGFFISLALSVATTVAAYAQDSVGVDYDERFNFYVISDSGRNGYYEQKSVAETMGNMTDVIEPEFIVTAGDTHHYNGIQSVNDPIWWTNFESIYTHPELLIDWYAALGNHEYHGNTQAVIDYSGVSRRWNMPSNYYAKQFEAEGATLLLVVIDTPPLIDKYRIDTEGYPDACKQSMLAQLKWLDKTLESSSADWVVVVGHHPIYAYTTKDISERTDMQERVDTILRRYDVDLYMCGHIHSFQHIKVPNSSIDYIVNGSGSLGRDVEAIEGTQFCSGAEGFSIVSLDQESLIVDFIDKDGQTIYSYTREK